MASILQLSSLFLLSLLASTTIALKFDQQFEGYNLNENQTATNPLDYFGQWLNHKFHPSPTNWRFPFYTLFLDKFVNGDPTNDNINGTLFEQDVMQTQLRHGGDIQGVIDSLDYIQGMGVKGLYVAGSPFINMPWGADSYSPLDLTLLDLHYGNIEKYREMVTEIHKRGMYIIADNTMSTLGDLHAFEGFVNASANFKTDEYKVLLRDPNRRYLDFEFGNEYNQSCQYPRFWDESGFPVGDDVTSQFKGCYNSEFDQYGDTEAFGVFPDWQRQLSKFASVQDRLREWVPSVRSKLEHFSCLTIRMLDIDGFRFDKATQITVDALGDFSHAMRECARSVGKENFFLPGEITGGNTFGSVYLGRGRQPNMMPETLDEAVAVSNRSNSSLFIRDEDKNALDSAAFHYSIYRSLTRFLGMDGNLESGYDVPVDFVDTWNLMLLSNDFVNPNTNEFDPRHMYGIANQDVFRWPAVKNGIDKQLLASFITTLHMPGIPLMLWGEEQGFYVLDNTADNYVFGRQAMSASLAWETHGCYQLGAHQYYGFDDEKAKQGCNDPWNSKDHRDPSHPLRNVVKAMLQMRENYPVLNDGMFLQSLSKQTRFVQLPGSNHTQTELGMWSTVRDRFAKIQDLSGIGQGNQSVWLVYQNDNTTIDYMFDCGSNETALIAPYDTGTTVKNLFYPYEEIKLKKGPKKLGINGSREFNGCLDHLELRPWEFKAFVPKDKFVANGPMITNFVPGHDERIVSLVAPDQKENVAVEFHFSTPMDCHSVSSSIEITSTTADGSKAKLDNSTAKCETISNTQVAGFVGSIPTQWTFKAQLTNVANGIHSVTIKNATASNGKSTNSIDHFIFRIGQSDNPIVFPRSANYTTDLLHRDENGGLFVSHKAAGAEMWRYTLDWSHFSDWMPYTGGDSPLAPKIWTGTTRQGWDGEHVIVQYYSKGSSNHIQHGDLDQGNQSPRRFPHLFVHGPFNQFGFDGGISNSFRLDSDGLWRFDLMTEWPTEVSINEWGINPDGKPDSTGAFGDVDRDGVLDRMPPSSLASSILNLTSAPPLPNLGWTVVVNDGTYQYKMVPVGNIWTQIIIFIVSWVAPIASATLSVWAFMGFFYSVKFNKIGIKSSKSIIPAIKSFFEKAPNQPYTQVVAPAAVSSVSVASGIGAIASVNRRTVLIATLEYDIEDWIGVKIKIGGLGTMAQLMGKSLGHQDLIWVVPCVGDIEYPEATGAEPMQVTILGQVYDVEVQYHQLRNMTYVLLDAPVFRKQTKTEPYPARMDDLDSAVYYSTWNQCIAQAITRFSVDLYHINDYHGAAAPLYLLPEQTVPACLSLHNAEFQGLWPLKNPKQFQEVCSVFNLPSEIVEKYVQFGDVFNLLHAGSSYIRIHQKGFGAVGVSKKYGDRSHARYPIFWGLKKIGQLPNPDPTDVAEWTGSQDTSEAVIDEAFEAGRPELKRQAQEWAGLIQDPEADLFVFVGRWSMQKGIDLIADVMPAVLEDNPKVQLICVGPVIDLYGKFAALKLDVLMKKYKGRVYSKPEFTALPPYIFSGAEFALIPSRDEPFGLVAVEFGRKGALSIGSRVGGLGQMPGWWFTVESMTTSHMLRQFKSSIKEALASSHKTRRTMRARSAKQRFPVAAWIEQLEALQSTAIKLHQKEAERPHTSLGRTLMSGSVISLFEPSRSRANSNTHSRNSSRSRVISGAYSRPASGQNTPTPGTPRLRPLSGTPPNGTPPLVHPAFNAVYGSGGLASESDLSLDQPFRGHRRRATSRGYFDLRDTPDLERGRDSPDFEHEARYDSDTSRPGSAMTSRTLFLSPGQARGASRSPRLRAESMSGQDIPLDSENLLGISIQGRSHPASTLSLSNIVGDKTDYQLQKIDPDFTDSKGEYYKAFEQKLEKLTGDNSEDAFCIEEYLKKSEREWYGNFKNAKLGRSKSPNPSLLRRSRPSSLAPTVVSIHDGADSFSMEPLDDNDRDDEWLLGDGYVPPKGIKLWMQRRIGDWPIYSFFLAFGQIIAANSYQITLLTGTAGPNAEKIYITGAIYIATSFCWWIMFRMLKSVYVLSIPFFFYGGAFLFLAFVPFTTNQVGTEWLQNVATGMYAAASSSGSIYFALNFGDEGGSPIKSWVFRACVIQGTQQIYVVALWAWGNYLSQVVNSGGTLSASIITSSSKTMTAILAPIAILFWAIGLIIFFGLPEYYKQAPGKIPSFYKAIIRRKIVLWFFIVVIIQNYFLSASTGRNWAYLWSSKYSQIYQIVLLVLFFFIIVWAAILYIFSRLSSNHSWILPLFAIGLIAPRWAQILWATSNIGLYLPWTGSGLASALISRSLWLWLGTLDALQGVGFGMILLQTLTRFHIAYTLIAAQILGTVATMVARATAPNREGQSDLFPDFTAGPFPGLMRPWFWIGLGFQILVCVGFFRFFRKEQLSKP